MISAFSIFSRTNLIKIKESAYADSFFVIEIDVFISILLVNIIFIHLTHIYIIDLLILLLYNIMTIVFHDIRGIYANF